MHSTMLYNIVITIVIDAFIIDLMVKVFPPVLPKAVQLYSYMLDISGGEAGVGDGQLLLLLPHVQ